MASRHIRAGEREYRPPFVAIGLLAACVLAYEVLLTRLFSIVLWHHFAYMIISAAMLGYGVSGTALTLLKGKIAAHIGAVYVMAAAALAALALIEGDAALVRLAADAAQNARRHKNWQRELLIHLVEVLSREPGGELLAPVRLALAPVGESRQPRARQ